MAAPVSGNQDFRGYLNYLAGQGDTQAKNALNFTGNDGGIDNGTFLQYVQGAPGTPDSVPQDAERQYVANAYNTYNGLNAPTGLNASSSTPGAALPAANPNQSSIDLINSALGRLPTELQTADSNIQNQYGTNLNQLNSGEQAAQQQYNQGTNQNSQQFVTNKNQINDQASSGLQSLLRTLGAHGAGGSSAALLEAPNAVGTVASQQRSGAGQTFGQNQQGLDTTYNTYETNLGNSKKQLSDWLSSNLQGAQSTSEGTKQTLLQQLAGLQPTQAAAQPYIDQINQSANTVDQLAKLNPTYNGTTPTYTAPDISSYTVNQTGAPVLGTNGSNGTGAGTPFLNFLLGKDKTNQLAPTF